MSSFRFDVIGVAICIHDRLRLAREKVVSFHSVGSNRQALYAHGLIRCGGILILRDSLRDRTPASLAAAK